MRFESGRVVEQIKVIGTTNKTGSEVWFQIKYFTHTEINHATVADRLQNCIYLKIRNGFLMNAF